MKEFTNVLIFWEIDLVDQSGLDELFAVYRYFRRRRRNVSSVRKIKMVKEGKIFFFTIGDDAEISLAEWVLEYWPKRSMLRYHINPHFQF